MMQFRATLFLKTNALQNKEHVPINNFTLRSMTSLLAGLGTSSFMQSIFVVRTMDYLMESQQDKLYAMCGKWRWTESECGLISAIKASCLQLLTQDPGECEYVCNISVAEEYWELHHRHLTLLQAPR
ncbi:hypothetical protein XENOCAPTIV_027496 [Xenoophorus captivus]|uniref:Uncharacterized protein n=1 Tax=Xenoophorus captivus TaxID=1517983 RepID=A0ABV0SC32_9TELE